MKPSRYERRRAHWVGGNLTHEDFEQVVREALDALPKRFAEMIENVVIAVEDEPNADDLQALGGEGDDDEDSEIVGIYRGVALTERDRDAALLPDEIAIFRGPINRITRTRKDAVREVRDTVIHELGHYFGLGDDEMPH
ncbi:MAG: metallopeptidase family protein [Vulcanimicrobiaceae bacterium]|jgi:predicted Zn-dependent protease with MMP-like domain